VGVSLKGTLFSRVEHLQGRTSQSLNFSISDKLYEAVFLFFLFNLLPVKHIREIEKDFVQV